jgi:L-threonylcarbamoyladenylate synthase
MRRVRAQGSSDSKAIAAAVDVLRRGGIVAYPTDTLYGLAVDPASAAALARLFAVKERDRTQAIPLIAADLDQARVAGEFGQDERRLAAAFWPGPLALVVAARPPFALTAAAADGTIAIRVPAHPLARALAAAFGGCLTATSANLSGQPPTASADDVASTLGDLIDLLLDGGEAPGGPPSTIVAMRAGAPVLVRAGATPWDRVLESLKKQP